MYQHLIGKLGEGDKCMTLALSIHVITDQTN